jgi:arsenate reductase
MVSAPFNVLFLCTGNSVRSITAESLLNYWGKGKFRAFSAGSYPKDDIHPAVLRLLKTLELPTESLRSKSWDEFAARDAPQMDFIFNLCDQAAGETIPLWPGQPITAHWGLPNPAVVQGSEIERAEAFRDTLRVLENRIKLFVELPIATLDRMALAGRVESIGRIQSDTRNARAS